MAVICLSIVNILRIYCKCYKDTLMKISIDQELPSVILSQMTKDGPKTIELSELTTGKKVILIGMPGAFTKTCTNHHLPSLIRNSPAIFNKGIDEILCIVVNDIHVAKAWGEITGANEAGIKILCDLESKFSNSVGLSFSAPEVGFFERLQRVSIMLDKNVIKYIQLEDTRGACKLTSGETILKQIDKIFDH